MTHPNPQAEPDSTVKAAAPGAPATAAKPSRKAPRRATAAAGAPSSMEQSAPAILVIDANGMMVPAPAAAEAEQAAQSQDTSDAGHSPAADPAPLGVAEAAVAGAEVAEAEAVDSQSVEPDAMEPQSVQLEPESEPEPESVSEPEPESEPSSKSEPESEPASDPVVPLVSVVAAEAVALPAAVTPGSLSRRERRLAEQQGADGIASAAVKSAASESTDSGNAVSASSASEDETAPELQLSSMAKTAKKRNRFGAFLRGLFFLVVISALVVAMGTVLTGQDLNASGPSPTQLQRQAAWEATTKLQSEAVNLAEASSTPQLQKTLSAAATNLGLQAAALSDGLPTEAATETATASSTSTTGSAPAPLTVTGLVQGLSANAETLLGGALTAEQSMGRVFASVGTSQLLQAAELASVAGTTVPASTYTPALVDFPAASGPVCTSTLEPRPGATVDSALRAAAVGEQKAVYAYQVAATRFAEPQFSKATELLDRHQHKLELLNDELRLRCLPLAEPVAGFTLDSTFTSLPKQALSILEAQLSTIYGDLAALSPTKGSDQSPTSEPASASSATPEPEPTASAAGATPLPVNGSNLREMSVLWLLDSTQAYTAWGGSVEALPGYAPEITPGINPEPVVSSAPAS